APGKRRNPGPHRADRGSRRSTTESLRLAISQPLRDSLQVPPCRRARIRRLVDRTADDDVLGAVADRLPRGADPLVVVRRITVADPGSDDQQSVDLGLQSFRLARGGDHAIATLV